MKDLMTPARFRAAAQVARNRADQTSDLGLGVAYTLLARDFETLAASIDAVRDTKAKLGLPA
jgi:hypothetical protein